MLKVKIDNSSYTGNSFQLLYRLNHLLKPYGIRVTRWDPFYDTDAVDLRVISIPGFISTKSKDSIDLQIEKALEQLDKVQEPFILTDDSHDTSLYGRYELLTQSKALALYKIQLLKNREDYNKPYLLNNFRYGEDIEGVKYDIPQETWKKIRLAGFNQGSSFEYFNQGGKFPTDRKITLNATSRYYPNNFLEFGKKVGLLKNKEIRETRQVIRDFFNKFDPAVRLKLDWEPNDIYKRTLGDTRIGISYSAHEEISWKDFEIIKNGTILIKSDMNKIQTIPDFFIPGETYIEAGPYWSNLKEVLYVIMGDWDNYKEIGKTAQKRYLEEYTIPKLVSYWVNEFKQVSS